MPKSRIEALFDGPILRSLFTLKQAFLHLQKIIGKLGRTRVTIGCTKSQGSRTDPIRAPSGCSNTRLRIDGTSRSPININSSNSFLMGNGREPLSNSYSTVPANRHRFADRPDALSSCLFGTHVGRCFQPMTCQVVRRDRGRRFRSRSGTLVMLIDENIGWLDVAMDEPLAMGVVQCSSNRLDPLNSSHHLGFLMPLPEG